MLHSVRLVAALCLALALPGLAAAQDYTKWYLAEGSTGIFEQEILIGNPNNATATVDVQYQLPSGPGLLKQYTVAPRSRLTIRAHEDVPNQGSVSAVITSTNGVPIVVERSMYWGGAGRRTGGHNTTAVPEAKAEWFLAEGISNPIFDQFLLVQNPNPFPVDIEIAYLGDDGIADTASHTVLANSRFTINARVDLDSPFGGRFRNRAFSTRVTSTTNGGNIIVERAIYWGNIFFSGAAAGGTNAAGVSTLSDTWYFAEGFAEGGKANGFMTFLLLANPNPTPTTVDVTFLLEDKTTEVVTRQLEANSRGTVWVNYDTNRASTKPFSIQVKAQDGKLIAAERVMYWGGLREGHVVSGVTGPATQWAFADGQEDRFNGIDYDTYFLIGNATTENATVTATFLFEDGTGIQEIVNVGGESRGTLNTGTIPKLSNRRFAAFFSSNQPVVMERAVYWGAGYYGGHASAGVPWTNVLNFDGLQEPPAATVASASPNFGSTNGGTDVTIKGANFVKATSVLFGDRPAAGVFVADAETIVARSPGQPEGTVSITVQSLGNTATLANAFTYEKPAPPPPPPPPPPPQGTANGPAEWIYPQSFPYFFSVVQQVANARRDLLLNSCTEHDGQRIPGGNNEFMFEVVRRLRALTGSNRWGLNWKRGNAGDLSQDIVNYYYGPQGVPMEGRTEVFIIDIIGGHCGGNPGPNWQDQTRATRDAGTIGRWTTAGRNF